MPGIHHVTAIDGDPVKNVSFYTRDLGMRFVKKTVNFDDPSTYHFYFGDETGHPGTAKQLQQNGLQLVVLVMCRQQKLARFERLRQQPIARITRRRFQ